MFHVLLWRQPDSEAVPEAAEKDKFQPSVDCTQLFVLNTDAKKPVLGTPLVIRFTLNPVAGLTHSNG